MSRDRKFSVSEEEEDRAPVHHVAQSPSNFDARAKFQKEKFSYLRVPKPQSLSSTLYFRSVDMFRRCEVGPEQKGIVDVKTIISSCPNALKRDLRSIDELVAQLGAIRAETMHILTFLDIVAVLEFNDNEAKDQKRKQVLETSDKLDKLSRRSAEDEVKTFHDLTPCERVYLDMKRTWRRFKQHRRFAFPCWRRSFRAIEARHGSSVVSYFFFAQSIFVLNCITALLMLFVIVPGMDHFEWIRNEDVNWIGILLGRGMENSWMFYGDFYPNHYGSYRLDLAWVFVCTLFLFIALLYNLRHVGASNIKHDDEKYPFCSLVFNAIDNNLTDSTSMKLQRATTRTTLGTSLDEMLENMRRQQRRGDLERRYVASLRYGFGVFMSLCFGLGSAAFVAFLIVEQKAIINSKQVKNNPNLQNLSTMIVPLVVSFFKTLSPTVMALIVAFEKHPRAVERFRNVFVRIFGIRMFYVLVILFQTMYADSSIQNESGDVCPETLVGIAYYRLLIVDMLVELAVGLIIPYIRLLIDQKICFWKKNTYTSGSDFGMSLHADIDIHPNDVWKQEFKIPSEIIGIMYRQALLWSGTPFCPILPALAVVSNLILIGSKIIQVRFLTRPPVKPMGVARQEKYFRGLMVVTLALCVIPYSYFLRRVVACGPHLGSTPIDTVLVWLDTLPSGVSFVFAYLRNAVLLWLLVISAVVYTVYLSKKYDMLKSELHQIRRRVKMEVKEKRVIIRENGILLDRDQERGAFMFREWMGRADMLKFSARYGHRFQESYFGDLLELVKLDDEELKSLMKSWHVQGVFTVPEDHVAFFLKKINDLRRDLIA